MRASSRLSYVSSYGLTNSASILGSLDLAGVALPKERFTSGVSDQMICLICKLVSSDPVFLLCCHTNFYCYKCILGDKKDNPGTIICPSCSTPVNSRTLTRNDNLRNTIYSLRSVICDYASRGCTVLNNIDTINDHVEICVYQPVPCTNTNCIKICNLKDWEWHIKVDCAKRTTRCVGSCHELITADQIDEHDCDNVVHNFRQYQIDEIETLGAVFREEISASLQPNNISDRVDEWHLQQEMERIARSFSAMKYKQLILNEDDEVHDALGHLVHHGQWRCSSLDCTLPFSGHDFNKTFPDGMRHIFFWDCCLNDNAGSVSCDKFEPQS